MTDRRTGSSILIAAIVLILVLLAGILLGSVGLSPQRLWAGITGADPTAGVILRELRLPRVLAALLAGVGLSTAGLILQTVTDNKLCAPNIIGINSGSGFAVLLVTCLFPMHWELLPLAAFVGALFAAGSVLGISGIGQGRGKKTSVILAGVALSSMMSSGISFLSLKFPDALPSYLAFTVGGFSGVCLCELLLPAIIIAASLALALMLAPKIRLLCLGDEVAATLGVNGKALRTVSVILAAALAASAVSFAGLIGFVGLIVPHIAAKLSGGGFSRATLLLSALCGGILVILSDLVGRLLFAPGEIPAGIFLSLIGAPFFLWLLLKGRGGR